MDKDASHPPSSTAGDSSPAISSCISTHRFPSEILSLSPENQAFGANFASMYHSIFPPKSPSLPTSLSLTPSTCSPSSVVDDDRDAFATDHRLRQARLVLEYHDLCDRYDRCRAYLRDVTAEIESLRRENADLRLANSELAKVLSLSSQDALRNCFSRLSVRENNRAAAGEASGMSPTSVMELNRFGRRNVEQISLPKSISVRSSGYLQLNQSGANNGGGASRGQRITSPLTSEPNKVYVPAGKTTSEALEMEVYNQGMWKTELCNKWQETGACPYGNNCRFAHGITELRPVIRHPRYKTELCRMVLGGGACPYGHRCHFRHTMTDQEKLMGPR